MPAKLGFFGTSTVGGDYYLRHQADQLRRSEWVVYAKPPFGGPEQVLALSRRIPSRRTSPTAADLKIRR